MKYGLGYILVGAVACRGAGSQSDRIEVLVEAHDVAVLLEDSTLGFSARDVLDVVGVVQYGSAVATYSSDWAPNGGPALSTVAPFTVGPMGDVRAFVRTYIDPRTGDEVEEKELHIEGTLRVRSNADEFDVSSSMYLDASGADPTSIRWDPGLVAEGIGIVPSWVSDAREAVWFGSSCVDDNTTGGPEDGVATLMLDGPVNAPELELFVTWSVAGCSPVSEALAVVVLGDPEYTSGGVTME